jgi:hypothetical protein
MRHSATSGVPRRRLVGVTQGGTLLIRPALPYNQAFGRNRDERSVTCDNHSPERAMDGVWTRIKLAFAAFFTILFKGRLPQKMCQTLQ